jgi:hypothetical protein
MMRRCICCLLLLLITWGWVDDLLVSTADDDPGNDVFTSANDEYLASPRLLPSQKELQYYTARLMDSPRHSFESIPGPGAREGVPEGKRLALSATSPLYAFMSQQC